MPADGSQYRLRADSKMSYTYTEWATAAQAPTVRCDIHGGGMRNYAKEYNQEEWPRATLAVDLATIRPIAMVEPTLLGLSDVYNSVRPDAQRFDENIPVAKAIPVTHEDKADSPTAQPQQGQPQGAPATPAAVPVTDAQATPVSPEPEVRRAEAVKPLDTHFDAPAISAPTPEPINF